MHPTVKSSTMNRFIIVYLCSLALALSSFAQAPTASPIANTPAATATISATSTPASKIEQSIRKKHKKHFGFTIDDHDKDLDALDHLGDHKSGDLPEFVIPIVAITMLTVFGAPVLIVALIMYFSFSRSRALQKTVRMMVEKGQPVPEALLNPPPAQRQRSDLRRGVVLAMIGIGLMVFFGAVNDWEGGSWTLGLIPFLIGAGYLLVWKLDTKKDNPPPVP
jgi:Flp pilus assembly protein TadB